MSRSHGAPKVDEGAEEKKKKGITLVELQEDFIKRCVGMAIGHFVCGGHCAH